MHAKCQAFGRFDDERVLTSMVKRQAIEIPDEQGTHQAGTINRRVGNIDSGSRWSRRFEIQFDRFALQPV
ncbi:hypothetical protein K6U56_12180, partial [Vibrio furnissii]|uniref:hypothetical protein n=1 Tax=Vibrio furnissii TaxID=29494 RepID=UPI001EEAAECC